MRKKREESEKKKRANKEKRASKEKGRKKKKVENEKQKEKVYSHMIWSSKTFSCILSYLYIFLID